jgi:hypothetical protein
MRTGEYRRFFLKYIIQILLNIKFCQHEKRLFFGHRQVYKSDTFQHVFLYEKLKINAVNVRLKVN